MVLCFKKSVLFFYEFLRVDYLADDDCDLVNHCLIYKAEIILIVSQ